MVTFERACMRVHGKISIAPIAAPQYQTAAASIVATSCMADLAEAHLTGSGMLADARSSRCHVRRVLSSHARRCRGGNPEHTPETCMKRHASRCRCSCNPEHSPLHAH